MSRWGALVVVFVAAGAAAQDLSPPPLLETPPEAPPVEVPAAAPPAEAPVAAPTPPSPAPSAPVEAPVPYVEPSFYERCFAVPAVYFMPAPRLVVGGGLAVRGPVGSGPAPNDFHGAKPANGGASGGSSGASGGGGGGGLDGKAALVIAVVALVALPVVVYVIDDDADPLVVQRFHCPSFAFEGLGGMAFVPGQNLSSPLFSGRVTTAYSHFGADFQFDLSGAVSGFASHALIRITPKQHVEGAVALGYRAMYFQGGWRDGFEVGLPHRYVFWRSGLNAFGLELRPMLQFGPAGVDAALEATLVIPLFELLNARVGGRVFSYGQDLVWTAQGGLTFTW